MGAGGTAQPPPTSRGPSPHPSRRARPGDASGRPAMACPSAPGTSSDRPSMCPSRLHLLPDPADIRILAHPPPACPALNIFLATVPRAVQTTWSAKTHACTHREAGAPGFPAPEGEFRPPPSSRQPWPLRRFRNPPSATWESRFVACCPFVPVIFSSAEFAVPVTVFDPSRHPGRGGGATTGDGKHGDSGGGKFCKPVRLSIDDHSESRRPGDSRASNLWSCDSPKPCIETRCQNRSESRSPCFSLDGFIPFYRWCPPPEKCLCNFFEKFFDIHNSLDFI
jgi:hypothetical protein